MLKKEEADTVPVALKVFGWYAIIISSIAILLRIVSLVTGFNDYALADFITYVILGIPISILGIFAGRAILKNKDSAYKLAYNWAGLQVFIITTTAFTLDFSQTLRLTFDLTIYNFAIAINFVGIVLVGYLSIFKRKGLIKQK